jgi:polysaccharide pyruvyl transferase WcaK-like protein
LKSAHLCVVADVAAQADYHLGDEAMLEANLSRLRQILPGIRLTVFSRDPEWTSRRYGVGAVRTPQFPDGVTEEAVQALADADGLVVSGGGNLCGTWPEKIFERVVLIDKARALGRPVVVVGQTIGPTLTDEQKTMLARALPWAAWVGVRDDSSGALARSLGVPDDRIHRQLDDAFFLEPQAVDDGRADAVCRESRPVILVTLDASFGAAARRPALGAIASQLDAIAEWMGAALVFVPHVGGADVPAGHADEVAGRALGDCLTTPLHMLDLWQPRETRWLAGQAAMVVSTRYHPLVFATAAGIPALGIHQDDYTRIKLRGALAWAGLEGWCTSIAGAERGELLPLAAELWHHRATVKARLAKAQADGWSNELQRWSAICRALELAPAAALPAAIATSSSAHVRTSRSKGDAAVPDILSADQWQQFENNGYLRLGRVLDEPQLAALRTRIDDIMLGRVRYPSLQTQLDTGGRYEDLPDPQPGLVEATLDYRKMQGLEGDPLVLDLIRRDVFREICARVYGRHTSISIFRAMLMNKPAGKGTHLPWHQDAGDVWKLDRDPIVTSWIALDPATRANGCVQVIPGSHRLGLLSKNGSTISDAHAKEYCPEEAIVHLEVGAGDAVVLHNWMLHRSGINSTAVPRRALSACYMDGRTLNTASGTRFPIVFGEHEEVDAALPFVQAIKDERRYYEEKAAELERYAKSLLADNHQRELMRSEAERYALSLEAELARIRST